MPDSIFLLSAAAIITLFWFMLWLLEWKRRDTRRRIERLVHRNLIRTIEGR